MDELIDILTPEGKPTGRTALKSEAHKNGWFHTTVHIWFFTSDEKILLQKRAMSKKVFPGLDKSQAGERGIMRGYAYEMSGHAKVCIEHYLALTCRDAST